MCNSFRGDNPIFPVRNKNIRVSPLTRAPINAGFACLRNPIIACEFIRPCRSYGENRGWRSMWNNRFVIATRPVRTRKIRAFHWIVVTVLTFGFAWTVVAETLYLKDGTRLTGRIVAQDQTSITIETSGGRRRILKSQLSRVDFNPTRPETDTRDRAERERQERERTERERIKIERERENERLEEAERQARESLSRQQSQRRDYGAIWRAALLPGWGHRYAGRDQIGTAISLSTAGLLIATNFESRRADQERMAYRETANQTLLIPFAVLTDLRPAAFAYALDQNASRERAYRFRTNRRDLLVTLAFLTYTVQLGHAVSLTFSSGTASGVRTSAPEIRAAVSYAF